MASHGEEPAASDSDRALEQIARIIRDSPKLLFLGDADEAVEDFRRARVLLDVVDPAIRPPFAIALGAFTNYAKAMAALRLDGDRELARRSFGEAKADIGRLRAEFPEDARKAEDGLRPLAQGIDLKLLELDLADATDAATAAEAERRRLAEKRTELMHEMGGADKGVPKPFARAVQIFLSALSAFGESSSALAKLDLEEARRRIDAANVIVAELSQLIAENPGEDEVETRVLNSLLGFGSVFAGQQAYVSVLHEAVVGEVRERHVAILEAADEQVRAGVEELVRGVSFLERAGGQLIALGAADGLRSAGDAQRTVLRNLKALVKERLTPREVTRRSAPRFAAYFVITFMLLLIGVRLSGLVDSISGTELLYVLGIALVVAAGSSFGWEAAVHIFDSMPWTRKPSPEVPPAQTHRS